MMESAANNIQYMITDTKNGAINGTKTTILCKSDMDNKGNFKLMYVQAFSGQAKLPAIRHMVMCLFLRKLFFFSFSSFPNDNTRIIGRKEPSKETLTGGIADAKRDDAIGHLGILLEVGGATTANLGEEISASKLGEVGIALNAGHGEGRGRLLGRLLGSHKGRSGADEESSDGKLHR